MGGKKLIAIEASEIQDVLTEQLDNFEVVGTSCRSQFFFHHGVPGRGMLYRTGEHLLVTDSENDLQILKATAFFSV